MQWCLSNSQDSPWNKIKLLKEEAERNEQDESATNMEIIQLLRGHEKMQVQLNPNAISCHCCVHQYPKKLRGILPIDNKLRGNLRAKRMLSRMMLVVGLMIPEKSRCHH